MWDITEMDTGEGEKREDNLCIILCPFLQEDRSLCLFCEALQIKLSSKNILIELGWTEDGSLVQLHGVIYASDYITSSSKRRRWSL